MKKFTLITLVALALASCAKTDDDMAQKMAQADVAQTDILLQQTIAKIASTTDRYERNMLGVRRDSLQARYDAMCGVVKMIRMRQKQEQKQ